MHACDVGQLGRPALVHVATWRRPRPLTAAGRRRHADRLHDRQRPHAATWRRMTGPAGARACAAAQHRTTPHNTAQHRTRGRRRPAGLVHDRRPAGHAPGQALELVHRTNPAGRLDQQRAHNSRHDRQHEKQKASMHAWKTRRRKRPRAAAAPPPPPLGAYPHSVGC